MKAKIRLFMIFIIFNPIISLSETKDNSDERERKTNSRLIIEEVVVKAQLREENIKDVPISISAFSAGQLEAKGVYSQVDLPKITPGLNFTSSIGLPAIYLRGIGTDGTILADPLVVSYVDGVYFPDARAQFQNFGTIEKVEVRKGRKVRCLEEMLWAELFRLHQRIRTLMNYMVVSLFRGTFSPEMMLIGARRV